MVDSIADEKYVSLTTFRRNGDPVSTPVWIADLGDDTAGFTTASSSYKVKRLGNNPSLTLQPCDSRGNPRAGTEPVSGTGSVVSGAEFDRVKAAIKAKYGIQFTMISVIGRLARITGRGSGTNTAVIVNLD